MLHHVVVFRWKEGVAPETVTAIQSGLLAFAPGLSSTISYHCGPDVPASFGAASAPARYDFAVMATFADLEGYKAYADHPEHIRIRDEIILPNAAERCLVQFES
ncbi:MAG: Dabb family protein [Acidimicrobiia bacterium]